MGNNVTIKDVAREAGVAISTTSNALNGSNLVSEETRKKVLEAAKRLKYVPNVNGQRLKSGRSNSLCFITSNIRGEYNSRLLDAVNELCVQKGYGLNIVVTWEKPIILSHIYGRQFDGYFIFEGERIQQEDLEHFAEQQITAVLLDRKYCDERIGSVVFDSFQAGYDITKHLLSLGHKDFCFVDSKDDVYDSVERKRGFFAALQEAGITCDGENIVAGLFDEDISYGAVLSLCAKRRMDHKAIPSAFVCGNDASAIGAIKALRKMNLTVPEDASVVGFDDIELAQYFIPSLSTVRNPIEEQGRSAVLMMLQMLDGGKPGYSKVLPGRLISRNSSGVCRHQ